MSDLKEKLQSLLKDPENRVLAADIFGTEDAAAITASLGAFCGSELGTPIDRCLSCHFSVGAGIGLALEGGRDVFVKVFRPGTSIGDLRACSKLQAHACRHGFPAPEVMLGPTPFQNTVAIVHTFMDVGAELDAHDSTVRAAMAHVLADLTLKLSDAGIPLARKQRPNVSDVWSMPHNALFDFASTTKGAEWIDEKAKAALKYPISQHESPAISHGDWSMKNMRFDGTKVVALYDWDSLVCDAEAVIVGEASMSYLVTWALDIELTPTPDEALAFALEYEKARGQTFSSAEWRTIGAAATYLLAYGVRCQHALSQGQGSSFPNTWKANALRSMASEFYFEK